MAAPALLGAVRNVVADEQQLQLHWLLLSRVRVQTARHCLLVWASMAGGDGGVAACEGAQSMALSSCLAPSLSPAVCCCWQLFPRARLWWITSWTVMMCATS